MNTRTLGRSGINVSMLGLGTARIGGLNWNRDENAAGDPTQVEGAIQAIHRALDLGVTFFDTADAYGNGHSERILGQALATRRQNVIIATKFGDGFDPSEVIPPETIFAACEASLHRLNTDYIDLYLFHLRNYDIEQAGTVCDILEALVDQGKIRYYGWSTDDLDRARLFAQGQHCTAIEHRFFALEDSANMLALCDEYNLASVNRIPLGMGLLTGRWTANTQLPDDDRRSDWFQDEVFLKLLERAEAIRPMLTQGGRSFVQGALGWIWARSERTIPIPGFRTLQQVEELAGAANFGPLKDI
jgi:aryl-alcohol dehydrogenase-like predicted oxidoreductase